jgi:nitrite reductase/ring-hydroxylating ferredoxin subunit
LIEVGRFDDLVEGVPVSVRVEGREIVLVRWQEQVYAARNICPHQSRALVDGHVHRGVACGDYFGEMEIDEAAPPIIACPWHSWRFDLRTGRCGVDPRLRVRTYTTAISDGRVMLDVGRSAQT